MSRDRRSAFRLLMMACVAFGGAAAAAAQSDLPEEAPTGPPARPVLRRVMRSLEFGGEIRRYGIYVPLAVERIQKPAPVVMVLHGAMGDGESVERYLGFNEVAEAERFIVVYPEGVKGAWNDGRPDALRWRKLPVAMDDVGFLDRLAQELATSRLADPQRIYLTGISNGGFLVTRMACDRSERFAAYAPLISGLPAELAERCAPPRALPVLMINGTNDGLVRWAGTERSGHRILPVLDQARFWASRNGCASAAEQRLNDVATDDGSTIIWASWSGCRPGGAVEFYGVEGGGHQLPSMRTRIGDLLTGVFLGARNHDMETAEVLWRFFSRYRLPAP